MKGTIEIREREVRPDASEVKEAGLESCTTAAALFRLSRVKGLPILTTSGSGDHDHRDLIAHILKLGRSALGSARS